jgi:hypothetical protein
VPLVRAWIGVHRWRLAAGLLAAAAALVTVTRNGVVESVGGHTLYTPVPWILLVPMIASVAVGIGAASVTQYLPDPPRAKVARAAWLLFLALAATAVCLPGVGDTRIGQVTVAAVIRNVLFCIVLAMPATLVRQPQYCWILPSLYLFAAAQFGLTTPGSQWWAMVLRPGTQASELLITGVAFAAIGVIYALRRPSL